MHLNWGLRLSVFCALFPVGDALFADDWPQWLGPKRDAVWRESGIVERFPTNGPPVRWRTLKASEKDTTHLNAVMCTPFLEDRHIYGVCSYGQLRCLKMETGERVWETFQATTDGKPVRWANTFLVKNGDRSFLFNEKGDLIIARLSPQGYEEISRAHLLKPANKDCGRSVVWSHPAFANRCCYARNDKKIICVDLAANR